MARTPGDEHHDHEPRPPPQRVVPRRAAPRGARKRSGRGPRRPRRAPDGRGPRRAPPGRGLHDAEAADQAPRCAARRTSWSPGAADVESENDDDVSWSDDAASLDEELREPARVDEVTHACLELLRGGRATRWRSACDAFLALRLRPVSASSLRSSYICARERKDRRHALGAVNAPPRRRARRCPGHAPGAPEGLPRPVCGGTRRGGKSGARAGVRRWRRAGPLRRLRSSAR